MAGSGTQRSLEQTPTWAVAAVCFVLLTVSIVIEYLIHLLGKWLRKTSKRPLYEALEKIKAELMLLGFISLLLTVIQDPVSRICIPKTVGQTWHPCSPDGEDDKVYDDKCLEKGKMQFFTTDGLHQLHIFIFVLALFHVLYCIMTLGLGTLKMRKWKAWEDETKTLDYQFYNDPERFRFARDTTFGRRHLHFWTESPTILWIVCFFRQFTVSVAKVDYLTLRHGFIMAHLSPNSHASFDFQKYISRTLTEDFKVVVGISPVIWFLAVLFLLCNTHGSYSYYWLPFIPLAIILMVGAKLEMIITKMGLRIQDRGAVVKGTPVVKPGDDLFWFNRPRLLLFVIHFVLFQNAFQLAFLSWSWYQFGIPSCFHSRPQDIAIRLSMGILIQLLCSYVTLPLYALVTQMGTTMKPAIFNEKVASALKSWHNTAKRHIKDGSKHPSSENAAASLSSSPIHLLQGFRNSSTTNYGRDDHHSLQTSPRQVQQVTHFNGDEQDPEASRSHHEISTHINRAH